MSEKPANAASAAADQPATGPEPSSKAPPSVEPRAELPPVAAVAESSPPSADAADGGARAAAERGDELELPDPIPGYDEAVFSEPPPAVAPRFALGEPDPRHLRLAAPEVAARRLRNRRVVGWALGACVLVLGLGFVRIASKSTNTPGAEPNVVAEALPPALPPTTAATADPPSPSRVPEPAPSEAAPSASSVITTPSAPPAVETSPDAPPAVVPSGTAAVADDTPTPKELKSQARRLLESGKHAAAIEAARRLTELDPDDAEGWLLRGAAEQARGMRAEARKSFQTCTTTAKRGPKGECAAMLR